MILVHGQAKVHQLSTSTWQPGCHLPPDLCLPCLGWMDLRQKHLQRQFWQKAGLPQPNLLPDSKMSRRNYTNGVLHIVWAAWIKCLFCHFWVQMTVSLVLIFIIDNIIVDIVDIVHNVSLHIWWVSYWKCYNRCILTPTLSFPLAGLGECLDI